MGAHSVDNRCRRLGSPGSPGSPPLPITVRWFRTAAWSVTSSCRLHAAGRSAEALRHADEALRLGTPRASFRWRRSEIRRSLGDVAGADQDLQATTAESP